MSANVKRKKRFRKTLETYEKYFQLTKPYRVIMDPEFIQACLKGRTQIKEFIPKILHCEKAEFIVTKCIIHELWKLGQKDQEYVGGLHIAKTFRKVPCCHIKGDYPMVPSKKCINRFITASQQAKSPPDLVVAAQAVELRSIVRSFAGLPLLFMHGKVPIVEPLSKKSLKLKNKKIHHQSSPLAKEIRILQAIKRKLNPDEKPRKKKKIDKRLLPWPGWRERKKVKRPNPLSCLKKKKKKNTLAPKKKKDVQKDTATAANGSAATKRKRKRQRKKKQAEPPSKNPT